MTTPNDIDAAREWQPIETAPKDGTVILLRHEGGVNHAVYLSRKDIWVSPDGADGYDPIEWASLRRSPKESR